MLHLFNPPLPPGSRNAATILLPGASFPPLLPPPSFLLLFVDCCFPCRCHCRRRRCRHYSLSPLPPFLLLFVDCCLPSRCHCRLCRHYSLLPLSTPFRQNRCNSCRYCRCDCHRPIVAVVNNDVMRMSILVDILLNRKTILAIVGRQWHQTDEGYVGMSWFFCLWTGLHTRLNGRRKHTSLGMPVCHFFGCRWTIPYKIFY